MSRLVQVDASDEFYNDVQKKMRSTISNDHLKDVQFADYFISTIYRVNNDELKQRFSLKKQSIEQETGQTCPLWVAFHGSEDTWKIARHGFKLADNRPSNNFGEGIFFAPESSKANMFAFGNKKGCRNHGDVACTVCPRTMLVCLLAMGKIYRPDRVGKTPSSFQSLHADPKAGVPWLNYDEIAVMEEDQALPMALVVYRITNEAPNRAINSLGAAVREMQNPADDSLKTTALVVAGVVGAFAGTFVRLMSTRRRPTTHVVRNRNVRVTYTDNYNVTNSQSNADCIIS